MSKLVGKSVPKELIEGIQQCYSEDILDRLNLPAKEKWLKEEELLYHHLSLDRRVLIDSLLRGAVTSEQYPPARSRVIKIYTASTASDMNVEKTMLQSTIYPSLRDYCRSQYQLDFQVIDLHYGISEKMWLEIDDDHSFVEICEKEILRTMQKSAGPCFMCLFGQRYGPTDLPARIQHNEFEKMRDAFIDRMEDIKFIHQWYVKDSNAIPAHYVLQPISSILGKDRSRWPGIKKRLMILLREGMIKKQDDWKVYKQLSASMFHHDISQGIVEDTVHNRCLLVMRAILDVHKMLDHDKVDRYLDIIEDSNRLNYQRHNTMEHVTGLIYRTANNISDSPFGNPALMYRVKWDDPSGMHPKAHADYLEQMGRDVYQKLKVLIDGAMETQSKFTDVMQDMLYEENLFQWQRARENIAGFIGRHDELDYVKEYLLDVTCHPLIVHGESGIGKSAVMSMAATMLNCWFTQADRNLQTTVIYRQCGATSESTGIRQMLKGFCHQIAYTTDNYRHRIPDDYAGVKKHFVLTTQKGEFQGLVAIFIDGLDHLSPDDDCFRLDWLPTKIANNVKIIVSTTNRSNYCPYKDSNDLGYIMDYGMMSNIAVTSRSDGCELLTCLRRKVTSDDQYLEIEGISAVEAIDLLDNMLKDSKRSLLLTQWKLIRDCVQVNSSPLYIKSVGYETISQWTSGHDAATLQLQPTMTFLIELLLSRLEKRHGKLFVTHALGLLTATGDSGLSEMEIVDILSLDDDVLNGIFVDWEPKIRRLPPFLWSRLYHDIAPYAVEVERDRCTVLRWSHDYIARVVFKQYLEQQFTYRYLHSLLADYYLGRWNQTIKKHFAYPPPLAAKLKLDDPVFAALRYTPLQSSKYGHCEGKDRYNIRKLNCLPLHLLHAGRYADLCEHVLFNHSWILTKIQALSVQEVLPDYNLTKGKDAQLVRQAIQMSETALTANPLLLCMELSGRLLPYYRQFPNIKELIDSCDLAAQRNTLLVPNWQTYTAPGGALQYMCELDKTLTHVEDMMIISAPDLMLLGIKPFLGNNLHLWDVVSGEMIPGFELPTGSHFYQTSSGDHLCAVRDDLVLETYKLDSGEIVGQITCLDRPIGQVSVGNKYLVLCHDSGFGPTVIDLEAQALLHRFPYEAQAVSVSHDDHYFICNSRDSIFMHQFPLMERMCAIKCEILPRKLTLCRGNDRFYGLFAEREILSFSVNLMKKTVKSTMVVRDRDIQDFVLSYTERYILVRLARQVYLIHTDSNEILQTISKMPSGVFVDEIFEFVNARFTPEDIYIVAARHTYLGIWDTATGQPMRVLQTNISPITAMFTCRHANRVVTTLVDRSMQVWNVDNIDSSIQYCNTMVQGGVALLNPSTSSANVVCVGTRSTEAKVINLNTGECCANLVHELSDNSSEPITEALISPCGRYVVTRTANTDIPQNLPPWDALCHDILWDVAKQDVVYQVTRNRYVLFSPNDEMSVFFRCSRYNPRKWVSISYYVIVLAGTKQNRSVIEIPKGDLVTPPIMAGENGQFLTFIQQQSRTSPNDTDTDTKSGAQPGVRKVRLQGAGHGMGRPQIEALDTHLCVHSFTGQWVGVKQITLHELWSGVHLTDRMLCVKPLKDNNVLVIYGKAIGQFHHDDQGIIDLSRAVQKGALVYDVKSDCILHRMDPFLHNASLTRMLQISHLGNAVMDQRLRVYETMSARLASPKDQNLLLDLTGHNEEFLSDVKLVLDGRYIAAIVSPGARELAIWRVSDGTELTRCFIHGHAVCLCIANDDRTLLIGCEDGRIMALSLLTDLSDAVKEHVSLLPSRSLLEYVEPANVVEITAVNNKTQTSSMTSDTMSSDIRMINRSLPQLRALSAANRSKTHEQRRQTNSYRRVHSAVNSSKSRPTSQACCIQ